MKKSRYTADQIIGIVSQHEAEVEDGELVPGIMGWRGAEGR